MISVSHTAPGIHQVAALIKTFLRSSAIKILFSFFYFLLFFFFVTLASYWIVRTGRRGGIVWTALLKSNHRDLIKLFIFFQKENIHESILQLQHNRELSVLYYSLYHKIKCSIVITKVMSNECLITRLHVYIILLCWTMSSGHLLLYIQQDTVSYVLY